MAEALAYAGRDLESMSLAHNYHRWILDLFAPHLGRRVVEVGAGAGSFSELLLGREPESLTLVEPDAGMHRLLVARVGALPARARVRVFNDTFAGVARRVAEEERPDSIVYVNVLEHVCEDEAELRLAAGALPVGGRVFLFVPAFQWLYGSFDRQVGHRRRYTRAELEAKCARAGLRVLKSVYFDAAGVLPWWLKYRVLRSEKMEPAAVKFYDEFCVPVVRRVEALVPPPVGKNVLLVAEKG
ncbi:MAG: class I SAM-dependent methyltransferase [Acidobacteria bacterium]|nr:class I SAM-dependent methyltransferase [Acidobacteriota bacterium]MCA1620360.1 class I SAM-dependent methyltransferase [Acidobacteriota bacterium]